MEYTIYPEIKAGSVLVSVVILLNSLSIPLEAGGIKWVKLLASFKNQLTVKRNICHLYTELLICCIKIEVVKE